jgi:2-dehydropantoate 2-reductase
VPGSGTGGTVTPMRSYTVVGLGAIGGYYGARLQQAGHPVRFLARSDAEHVREHGLRIDSPEGDVVLDVEVHTEPTDVSPSDTVIVAVKTTATTGVLDLLPPLLAPGGSVLVMQNGLGVDALVATAVPDDIAVLGVMCFMCCNKVGPGHIHHLDQGAVTIGEHRTDGRPAGVTPAVDAAVTDLSAAGVSAAALEDLETGRWQKLVWNMAFNGLSVVEDAETDRLVTDPRIRTRAIEIMHEVVAAAAADGHGFDSEFVDRMVTTTEAMTPYKPSMKLDHEAGRPLELDAIYAAPIAAARVAGVDMPESAALLAQLRAMDPVRTT